MIPSIGFVILSYNFPDQTVFLCKRLSAMFGDPPIALHHDFGQCPIDRSSIPSNVRIVENWFATKWGTFPVVEANFAAIRLLYSFADPDWCVSLSTADYPIKTAREILDFLKATTADGFLDHRELVQPDLPAGYQRDPGLAFRDPAWLTLAYNRYVAFNLHPSRLNWRLSWPKRPLYAGGPMVERFLTPFSDKFRPFGGDAWYTVNRRAAKILSAHDKLFFELRRHYIGREVPEESVYQTILCNRPDLRIENNNLRYTDWSRGGSRNGGRSPRILGDEDIPKLMASSDHFARKIEFDKELLHRISAATEREASKTYDAVY